MSNSLVSIIVPTKNSAANLNDFLASIKQQDYLNIEVIVNDDKTSMDTTQEVVKKYQAVGMNISYIQENISMAQGRKEAAKYANGEVLMHLDSDMKLEPGLVTESVSIIEDGADALVIPEESFGVGFWAKCKWLEKKCYEGVEQIESLRCLKTSVYNAVGGHNPALVFSEDKDLDIRVRKARYKVGRTSGHILHNEGRISLLETARKKMSYSGTLNKFAELHPTEFRWQVNIFNRYLIYLRNIRYLFTNPLLYLGIIFMKTCEFGAGAFGMLFRK